MHRILTVSVLACAALGAALPAEADLYTIDPVHSGVTFKVKHIFTYVPGRFTAFSGSINYDPKAVENSFVQVEIEAPSINTDMPKRDEHLKSPDFLDVAKYPKITFKSTKVRKVGQGKIEVLGDLTIRDVTKAVTLDVEILGVGPGPDGKTRAGFHATTKINRMDYGASWSKVLETGGLLVGEEVMIDLSVESVVAS